MKNTLFLFLFVLLLVACGDNSSSTSAINLNDDGKNGFLIPDGDLILMEQRICSLMNDEKIRKKQGLESKKAARKYSHEVIMNEWLHLFNQKKQEKK